MRLLLLGVAFVLSAMSSAHADDAADCARHIAAEDFRLAAAACRKAAERGIAFAQLALGAMYSNGDGVLQDKREAAKWYRLAAEQGLAVAQFNLGLMYYKGEGVSQDKREAAKWYRLAAEQEDAKAQFNLGVSYDNGEGVAQDKREAAKWYRLAAEQGLAVAQFNLGVSYDNGEGVAQDKREAAKWYRLAAEQGDADAQFNLGVSYDNGEGVAQDKREAAKWYRLAAEQGHATAQAVLGLMYALGEGVIRDYKEAYVWLSLAAIEGDENAIKGRDLAEKELTAADIRVAKAEAKRRFQVIEENQNSSSDDADNRLAAIAPNISPAPNPAQTAFENGWRSVVVVKTGDSQGSGVVIRRDIVATNCHVIDGGGAIVIHKADASRAQTDTAHYATVRRRDDDRDLCLLDAPDLFGVAANIRNVDTLSVGEAVYAIGAPEGLEYSLSAGVVSQLRGADGGAPLIQTDAAISPGSSGGGLFDGSGNLVGITTWKFVDENIEGITFAIPADWILDLQ